MNNLTQIQQEAKNAFLDKQSEQMLNQYRNAQPTERKAIIKNIDSFLSVVSKEEKRFWLKFRRKLEILNEKKILFPLGSVYMTPGAREALEESEQNVFEFLSLHQTGNWGELCEDDRRENELSVKEGFRILSSYKTAKGIKIYVITEADRSSTTILLTEDY